MPVTASCTGEGSNGDHCCYVNGVQCKFLVENTAGRRFACALLIKYGSWQKMNESVEYREIGDYWASRSLPFNYCETFSPLFCCRADLKPAHIRNEAQLKQGAV